MYTIIYIVTNSVSALPQFLNPRHKVGTYVHVYNILPDV